ncbi:alkaline phosphatase family protein [Brevibacillus laterosporus]|uniref:alkaline phosphatase family protein n=1 Tax=Brevibacillus laterosporus TaxID=1465 RepID=UPI000EB24667|nr:alkaline phosphatase family protein [Brevibacillus laterosporus]AYK06137.1 phosphodiesterase [Brevibacillus laterosporus]
MSTAFNREKIAMGCWSIFRQGNIFTLLFVVVGFLLFHFSEWLDIVFWESFFISLLLCFPIFLLLFFYDYPLHIRWFLLGPLCFAGILWYKCLLLSMAVYTICFYLLAVTVLWGIYHFSGAGHISFSFQLMHFIKRLTRASDSSSANIFEQLPKALILLIAMQEASVSWKEWTVSESILSHFVFAFVLFFYSYAIHQLFFTWKPDENIDNAKKITTQYVFPVERVYLVVLNGCNKEQLVEAHTPFLDWLQRTGTSWEKAESVYPADTRSCFCSLLTGTYPSEHQINSHLGNRKTIQRETILDVLHQAGKAGMILAEEEISCLFDKEARQAYVRENQQTDNCRIEQAIQIAEQDNPDFLLVQMTDIYRTGMTCGVYCDEYLAKINQADQMIAQFYHQLDKLGKLNQAVFMVCSDHGEATGMGGRVHLSHKERYISLLMQGTSIHRGKVVTTRPAIVSVAATIAYLLAVPYPKQAKGPVLLEGMITCQNEEHQFPISGKDKFEQII